MDYRWTIDGLSYDKMGLTREGYGSHYGLTSVGNFPEILGGV